MAKQPVFPGFPSKPVAPLDPEKFHLGDTELNMFSIVAQELTRYEGTKVEYYRLDIAGSQNDPLYGEPVVRKFEGPFRLYGSLAFPEQTSEAGETGFRQVWNSELWLPMPELEAAHMLPPGNGDIVRVWNMPFMTHGATDGLNVPGGGFYFDVTAVANDGFPFDTPQFVGFKLTLTRRSDDAPERRLRGL